MKFKFKNVIPIWASNFKFVCWLNKRVRPKGFLWSINFETSRFFVMPAKKKKDELKKEFQKDVEKKSSS